MRTLPTELINEILCYLPFQDLWKLFKTPTYDADPLKGMLLCAMRRAHGFEFSHQGFQHEITMQLAALEIRIRDGKRKARKHKASCIESLAKHNSKTICKYFDQTFSQEVDNKQRCCMDTLIHYVNEIALVILRQSLNMTTIPVTLVTLHFKICQYLLSAWEAPTPRTYQRLHSFLWSLPYNESVELFSSLEGSLWFVSQEAFVDILKRNLGLKNDGPTTRFSATSSKDKIFDLYVSRTHSPKEALIRIAIICGIYMNLGGSIVESPGTIEDPNDMFALCFTVCESEAFNANDKILVSSCILCFLIKCDSSRWTLPTFGKTMESWQLRAEACLQQDNVQESEELQLILKLICSLDNGFNVSKLLKDDIIPLGSEFYQIAQRSKSTAPRFSSFSTIAQCQSLLYDSAF
ncbi:hypothetical protein INT44_005140 [Umbelopsis vinacea]|uniref:F-box domain-containing protein n=1 Tax=Umbelopsis vinacea TaxID=44442 RepID=A0A8H7Q7H3_9FUNG|nr:hypothetical protein INT44_005140 [Umbelopsis vinacea]